MARWRLLEPDAEVVSELAREADVDPCAPACWPTAASRPGRPRTSSPLRSPLSGCPMRSVERRCAEGCEGRKGGERIGVFGDYDTDGITSAAVLFLALSHYTDNVTVGLPTRQTGYGLLEPYVRDLFAEGVDLLITADCGISNRREVALANELGMEVVVTDHHIPPEDPPDTAVAVLDPKLWDPDDPLAGVGVAWKFAWAVARRARRRRGQETSGAASRPRLGRAPSSTSRRSSGTTGRSPAWVSSTLTGAHCRRSASRHRGAGQGGRGEGGDRRERPRVEARAAHQLHRPDKEPASRPRAASDR